MPLVNIGALVGAWAHRELGLTFGLATQNSEILLAALGGMSIAFLLGLIVVEVMSWFRDSRQEDAVSRLRAREQTVIERSPVHRRSRQRCAG